MNSGLLDPKSWTGSHILPQIHVFSALLTCRTLGRQPAEARDSLVEPAVPTGMILTCMSPPRVTMVFKSQLSPRPPCWQDRAPHNTHLITLKPAVAIILYGKETSREGWVTDLEIKRWLPETGRHHRADGSEGREAMGLQAKECRLLLGARRGRGGISTWGLLFSELSCGQPTWGSQPIDCKTTNLGYLG